MKIRRLEVVAWVLIGTATTLLAADGTWIAPGGGAWSDTSKWQNQTVAEGSGATATFDAAGNGTVNNDMTALALRGVLLGAEDLCADLGCARTRAGTEILYSRSRVVLAARAASVPCFDPPFTDAADDEGAKSDAQFARALGFTGKAAISPRHVNGGGKAGAVPRGELELLHAESLALPLHLRDLDRDAGKEGE